MTNNDLKKLIEHIEQGGETARQLDLRTGRVTTVPVYEGEIGRKIGSTIGGIFGKSAGDRLGQVGSDIGDFFGGSDSKKPDSAKSSADDAGDISDFSKDSPSTADNKPADSTRSNQPTGNHQHDGSGIGPNDDPTDPKTWPPGVKPAPDYGYLDQDGMWIPTPFHYRDERGRWRIPPNHPANRMGIQQRHLTPFQLKVDELQHKSVYTSAGAIEQVKGVKLPGGAPQIPGYKQIDPGKFSTDAREPGLNKTIPWVYAYKKEGAFSKGFILIAPMLFYNTKLSIGRYYEGWGNGKIRTDDEKVPSENGPVYVSGRQFNVNDMILDVIVHVSVGSPNIGAQILKSISGSLKPA
jgi:hypothetical protein